MGDLVTSFCYKALSPIIRLSTYVMNKKVSPAAEFTVQFAFNWSRYTFQFLCQQFVSRPPSALTNSIGLKAVTTTVYDGKPG